jgi:hypothetical protein
MTQSNIESLSEGIPTLPLDLSSLLTRVDLDAWGQSKQQQFVRDFFASASNVKLNTVGYGVCLVHRLGDESPVPPLTVRVGRLNHFDSVCLFSCLVSSDDFSPQDLASILSMSDSNHLRTTFEFQDASNRLDHPTKMVMDALYSFRKKKVYPRIGEGLSKRLVHFAASMNKTELADCIRRAKRPNEVVNGWSYSKVGLELGLVFSSSFFFFSSFFCSQYDRPVWAYSSW